MVGIIVFVALFCQPNCKQLLLCIAGPRALCQSALKEQLHRYPQPRQTPWDQPSLNHQPNTSTTPKQQQQCFLYSTQNYC